MVKNMVTSKGRVLTSLKSQRIGRGGSRALKNRRVSRKPPRPTTLDSILKTVFICLYNYNF